MKSLRTLDLFSGAGGLSLGFHKAGFQTVAAIDNNAPALQTFSKNFIGSSTYNIDLSDIDNPAFSEIKDIDVMLGGPPCQGFSIAGKRDINDPRNTLFVSYLKLVEKYSPKAVVIENVPNILSMNKGDFANQIVMGLNQLGYDVCVLKLNAADFGVPQSRKRAFFIGLRDGMFPIHELEALKNNVEKLQQYVTEITDNRTHTKTVVGQPISSYFGLQFDGIYQNTAEVSSTLFSNANGA